MKHNVVNRRSTAATLAAALALGGGLSLAGMLPAFGEPMSPTVEDQNEDGFLTGAVVVSKYTNPVYGTTTGVPGENEYVPGNGAVADPSGTPTPDVVFKVCPVRGLINGSLDVLEEEYDPADTLLAGDSGYTPVDGEWWATLRVIADAFYAAPLTAPLIVGNTLMVGVGESAVNACTTGIKTDQDGRAIFSGLPLGLYKVTEASGGSNLLRSDPYLVTLPYRVAGSEDWIVTDVSDPVSIDDDYVVWTYPKNGTFDLNKRDVTTATVSYGSTVDYVITTRVPYKVETNFLADNAGQQILTHFTVVDTMDEEFTFPTKAVEESNGDAVLFGTVQIPATVTVDGDPVTIHGVQFDETTSLWTWSVSDNVATLDFTSEGMRLVNSFAADTIVTINYTATVEAIETIAADVAKVDNDVKVYWDDEYDDATTDTLFGGVMIHKTNALTHALIVPGEEDQRAIFQVSKTSGGDPIRAVDIDGEDNNEFTADDSGLVGILGLFYDEASPNCFANMAAPGAIFSGDDDYETVSGSYADFLGEYTLEGQDWDWVNHQADYRPGTAYWVTEIQEPEGYILNSEPHQVCVTGILDHSGHASSAYTYDDFEVTNRPADLGIQLPFTGEYAKYTPVFLGLLVIAGAFTAYVIRTRKVNSRQTI